VSARTHPRLVGAFVLGTIVLALAAILALSSGGWFEQRPRLSVFFPGSVRGLGPGAPVTFQGIKVGEVVEVAALLTGRQDPAIQVEVVLEIRGDIVKVPEGIRNPFEGLSLDEFAEALIGRGIRARMMSASLLTGQRFIELGFFPDEPARFAGLNPRYPELPTTPTALERLGDRAEELMNKLAELPLAEMLEDVRRVIFSARDLFESGSIRGAFDSADRSAQKLSAVLGEAERAVSDLRTLIGRLDGEATSTAAEARQTLRQAGEALDRAERSLASLEETLRGADDARVSATRTFDELSRALNGLANLVDYVQTHPEALVLGKKRSEEKP
jgi:paraquat-inducible protein B